MDRGEEVRTQRGEAADEGDRAQWEEEDTEDKGVEDKMTQEEGKET